MHSKKGNAEQNQLHLGNNDLTVDFAFTVFLRCLADVLFFIHILSVINKYDLMDIVYHSNDIQHMHIKLLDFYLNHMYKHTTEHDMNSYNIFDRVLICRLETHTIF